MVGSELIQKYLGDGPKLVTNPSFSRFDPAIVTSSPFVSYYAEVRELFRVAEEHAPSIVFIDEIDAVGSKRYDSNSGGTREIQRTMLELLNQLDGFDERSDVKVIMATNRIETLDPALLRPGRIDRKIEFPFPDYKTKRHIFQIHTSRMTLDKDVDLEEFVMAKVNAPPSFALFLKPSIHFNFRFLELVSSHFSKDELSGADIKAICTEAGMLALRERRMKVTHDDFKKAKEKALYRKKGNVPEGLYI